MPESQLSINTDIQKTSLYFWIFIIIHTLVWTLGPALIRATPTHDTLEGITWGLQWQLGYSKHPFLTAWLCAGITQLFDTVGWPVYLLAQLAVSATFFAAWQLAKQILPSLHALIATLILEGILFYNINSFNLTPDTLQSPLWAFLSLYFYYAVTTQRIKYWLCTALFAALCLFTKYQATLLFLSLFSFCLYNPIARKSFKSSGIYIAVIIFALLITPHLIWLYHHHFITLTYAADVSSEYTQNTSILNYISHPTRFFINYLIITLGLFILLWPFYRSKKMKLVIESFKWQFLFFAGFGPAILSLLICLFTGNYFPPRWATPYFFTLGIIAVGYLKPELTKKNIQLFTITLVLFSSLLFVSRMITLSYYPRPASDAFLPNKNIASTLSKIWHERYSSPLPFIAGSNYLVSLVTPYLSDRPRPYLSWNTNESPWINENDLHHQGGLFIWDEGQNYTWDMSSWMHSHLPMSVAGRFPELEILPNYTFYRSSDNHPVVIGVAILPPKH